MPVGVPVSGINANVHQIEHGLLREVLRRFLLAEVQSSRGAGGCGRVVCGAVAALDSLLAAHPVDRRGRCRSCRRSGWSGRRARVCLVLQKSHYWLRQPAHRVQAHLASELGVDLAPLPEGADPEATDMLPRVEPDPSDPPTDPLQTPVIPPTPRFQAGWPDRDHGGVGDDPESLRPRRGPLDDHSGQAGYVVLSGRRTEVTPGAD